MPCTPKFGARYRRLYNKSNAGRSFGVGLLVALFVAILIVAVTTL